MLDCIYLGYFCTIFNALQFLLLVSFSSMNHITEILDNKAYNNDNDDTNQFIYIRLNKK